MTCRTTYSPTWALAFHQRGSPSGIWRVGGGPLASCRPLLGDCSTFPSAAKGMSLGVTQLTMAFTFEGLRMNSVLEREGLAAGDEAQLGGFFKRVDNLVWIKQNSYYKEALEDCKERKKSLGEKLDRREKRVEELTNQIYNVVGFFSVFQGVILTAVTQLTQSNTPLCGKVWFPVVLSLLAAIAAAFGIGLKYKHLNRIDKLIHNERLELREAERREAVLQGEGKRFFFSRIRDARRRPQESYWLLKAVVVIGGVFAFTVIFILSYFVIFCDKFVIKGW